VPKVTSITLLINLMRGGNRPAQRRRRYFVDVWSKVRRQVFSVIRKNYGIYQETAFVYVRAGRS
jgi:hypothetical protein